MIIINFELYYNAGYTNQYLCPKGAWQEYLEIGQIWEIACLIPLWLFRS